MNNEKFKQLVHYIIYKTNNIKNVGSTVLYKILYFIDFNYYEIYEEKLSGETYIKLPHGAAPYNFNIVIRELGKSINKINIKYGGFPQKKYITDTQPILTEFTKEQIEFIDKSIKEYSIYNATQISDLCHKDVPYISAKDRDILDYDCVFYRDSEFSKRVYNN